MVLYQAIQRLLLVGSKLHLPQSPGEPQPPHEMRPLVAALEREHRSFDAQAVQSGQRYRSGYWAIYLLSALAVLSAVLPLALGWDSPNHRLHPFSGVWACAEVLMIAAVLTIYWAGHRHHWQRRWLQARTNAELVWYLPMLAPLLPDPVNGEEANWYLRAFDPGQQVRGADEVAHSCARVEPIARQVLAGVWANPDFVRRYGQWTVEVLEQQRHYHHCLAMRQHALEHRVHRINTGLFSLTAVAAVLHLAVHTIWLSVVTTFLPALGASLHGALAQSEAHRLEVTSRRLVKELEIGISRIQGALAAPPESVNHALRENVLAAIAVILEEHQDWTLLVRPHSLPLG